MGRLERQCEGMGVGEWKDCVSRLGESGKAETL